MDILIFLAPLWLHLFLLCGLDVVFNVLLQVSYIIKALDRFDNSGLTENLALLPIAGTGVFLYSVWPWLR